jgi:hypothetical protein
MPGPKKGAKINPRSLANLRPPLQKGQVLNPLGISRKRPLTDCYYEDLQRPMTDRQCKRLGLPLGSTFAEGHARQRNLDAIQPGGEAASREMREAIEGKAPQRQEVAEAERKEVTYRVEFVNHPSNPDILEESKLLELEAGNQSLLDSPPDRSKR